MFLTDQNILVFDELDSTNNYAKQMVVQKVVNSTVVLAHYQKNGKGQQGNFWESERGKNLTFSLVLYPDFVEAGQQFLISKVVSIALVKYLRKQIENVWIKWPNDIYVEDKKIAGILIENTIKGSQLDSSIVGIGLNVNQEKFHSAAPNPVSLKQLTQNDYSVEEVLNELLAELNRGFLLLKESACNDIDETYLSMLFRYKTWSLFRKDGHEFEARIVGVGNFGQLQLETKLGEVSSYMFKEVEFVI